MLPLGKYSQAMLKPKGHVAHAQPTLLVPFHTSCEKWPVFMVKSGLAQL